MPPTLKGRYVGQVLKAKNLSFTISSRTQQKFKGEVVHASNFVNADKNAGKKVFIVGAGTTAHDIAADHVENGVGEVVRSPLVQPG